MKSIRELMGNQVLLPIVQADTAEQGVEIARAMADAGLKLVEVVLRTQASIDALIAIKKELPELIVGAGTVISEESLNAAVEAGADFIVTPAFSPALLEKLANCGVPVLPGVSNAGDIIVAREAGFRELKLFPASLSGGAKFIAAMSSLFPDTVFCPTGGVSAANKDEYLVLKNCFAVGGTWVSPKDLVNDKQWQKITEACIEANKAV